VKWSDGWDIKPDVVYKMQQPYRVPAGGTVEYVSVKFREEKI
jgi:hypothetical protein